MEKLLELRCRELYAMLNLTEKAFGINSPEANVLRLEWVTLDRAFEVAYKE